MHMKRPMSRLQLLGVFLLSLLFLRTTCHPRPTASSQVATIDIAQDGHVVGVTSIPGLTSIGRASDNSLGRRSLGFGDFLNIGNGWNMYYSSWPVLALPVQPAALALANLYTGMVLQVRGEWSKRPPEHSLSLMYGGVKILMHCQEQPIPWLFVEKFADTLLQMTKAGWTGLYSVMLSQADTDTTIQVILGIVP